MARARWATETSACKRVSDCARGPHSLRCTTMEPTRGSFSGKRVSKEKPADHRHASPKRCLSIVDEGSARALWNVSRALRLGRQPHGALPKRAWRRVYAGPESPEGRPLHRLQSETGKGSDTIHVTTATFVLRAHIYRWFLMCAIASKIIGWFNTRKEHAWQQSHAASRRSSSGRCCRKQFGLRKTKPGGTVVDKPANIHAVRPVW